MNKTEYIGNENILNIPQKDLDRFLDAEQYLNELNRIKLSLKKHLVGLNYGAGIMVLESLVEDLKNESLKHKLTLL